MSSIHPPVSPSPRHPRRRPGLRAGILASAILVLAACGSDSDATESATTESQQDDAAQSGVAPEARFTVVVSDRPIADLVSQVAGDGVEVVSVVPMGADGHTYQPVPEDARALARADIYIENGMGLNAVVSSFAAVNYPDGTLHVGLADVIPSSELIGTDSAEDIEAHGHAHSINAHFWPDPNYAMVYVDRIVATLSAHDADNADLYAEQGAALNSQLMQLDEAFAAALATIPSENRKMVVYHDSWSYFGRRYDVPVIGAIQPTDFSEPSAAELRETIEEVRDAGVPAFFGSEVFPSDVLKVIEEESGAAYVADLSDDVLPGEPGTPEHSYQGMMLANTRTIVEALGGDPSVLDTIVLPAS
jgi:ABC-type Zn uptake system ZnuABC Zn-binding protein ZnuA